MPPSRFSCFILAPFRLLSMLQPTGVFRPQLKSDSITCISLRLYSRQQGLSCLASMTSLTLVSTVLPLLVSSLPHSSPRCKFNLWTCSFRAFVPAILPTWNVLPNYSYGSLPTSFRPWLKCSLSQGGLL